MMQFVQRPLPVFLAWLALGVCAGCDDGAANISSRVVTALPDARRADHDSATASPGQSASVSVPKQSEDRVLAVLIGGFDSDPTPAQLDGTAPPGTGRSGLYQLSRDLKQQGIAARFFNWDGSGPGEMGQGNPPGAAAIAKFLRDYHNEHADVPLVVVGNSWGGQTAVEVVTLLAQGDSPTPIVQLHLMDASSFLRSFVGLPAVPENVQAVTNYYTHNAITTGALADDERVENIDLGDGANGFLRDDWGHYDATNDWRAHVLVEWDPLIHRDIERRILRLAADR